MKRILKVLLILIIVLLVAGAGFILTLQLFEFRPDEVTELSVINDDTLNTVSLNSNIKIITFNTGYASLSETENFVMDGGTKARMDNEDSVNTNLEGISNILEREAADIVLLQEVDVDSKRSYEINQYDYYKNLLGTNTVFGYNYRCIFVPFPFSFTQMMGKVNSGLATFSEYEMTSASRVQLPSSYSWPLRLAHLKRCLLISRLPVANSDKELVVINVHMSAYDDGSLRAVETAALQEIMKAEYDLGNYVIVGGDFNQTLPGGYTVNSSDEKELIYPIKESTGWVPPIFSNDSFLENGFLFGTDSSSPTCRLLDKAYDSINLENNQYYVIDGFIVSDNISITDITTLNENFKYSDHNPVVMNISLNS